MKVSTRITLPCEPGATVYTINEDYFACDGCAYKAHVRYITGRGTRRCDAWLHRPLRIYEHIVEGFEVSTSTDGKWIVSRPGEWGYEGFEEFSGFDGNVYYTIEDAQKAIAELNALDTERERQRAREANDHGNDTE